MRHRYGWLAVNSISRNIGVARAANPHSKWDTAAVGKGREIVDRARRDQQDNHSLLAKLTGNFAGVYLTMLSIIQGVALTDLAAVTFLGYRQFTLVMWIQVATMLWLIILIWNHFMGDALMTNWVPDLEDAVLLFGTGVFELVGNHAIVLSLTLWLAVLAGLMGGWCLGVLYIRHREEEVVRDPSLLTLLRRRTAPFLMETLGGGLLLAVAAVVAAASHASTGGTQISTGVISLGASLLGFTVVSAIGLTSSWHWRRIRRYAQTGRLPKGL